MPVPAGAGYAALAGVQIWSGLQQAEMIREQSKLTQRISELNALFAEQDAYEAEKAGESEAARYQTTIDQTVGDQRTTMAAQGVDINFGTAAALQEETRLTGFLNTIDIKNQARAKALGYKQQARNIRLNGAMGASQAEMNASAAVTSGLMGAAATGISAYKRK